MTRRGPALTALQHRILGSLARVQFATPLQLAHWGGVQAPAMSKALKALLALSLIEGSLLTRPMIFYLSRAAGRLLNVMQASGGRQPSWSVMAHGCHANELEIQMSATHKGFHFLSRQALFQHGLNPAFGEHGALDAARVTWFVLLDDYLMGPDRIRRSWTRRHAPNRTYWPDPSGRVWREIVHRFLVVSTDSQQVERHTQWVKREGLPAEVRYLTPLWRTGT